MSFRDILVSWATWSKLTGNADDDWVDRLNHIYTVILLVIFATFVIGGSYVQEPIACWVPAEWPAIFIRYTHNICWIQNTYYVPMGTVIPDGNTSHLEITYYQYVPLILLMSAFFFKIPCLIWRSFSGFCGLDIQKMVEMAATCHYLENTRREEKVREVVCCIDRWLESNRQYHWNCFVRLRQRLSKICFFMNRRHGTYLTGLYLFTKLLFCTNVVLQFFMLDAFLGGFYSYWGIEALHTLAAEHELKESRRFPRATMCDFKVRGLKRRPEEHTVQCVLPLNLFNEKIFLLLWFWLVFVAIVTVGNVILWIYRTLFQRSRVAFVKKYLKLRGRIQTPTDKRLCVKFGNYLRDDGVFLLQMLLKNTHQILIRDIVNGLWDSFLEKPFVKKSTSPETRLANNHKGDANPSYV